MIVAIFQFFFLLRVYSKLVLSSRYQLPLSFFSLHHRRLRFTNFLSYISFIFYPLILLLNRQLCISLCYSFASFIFYLSSIFATILPLNIRWPLFTAVRTFHSGNRYAPLWYEQQILIIIPRMSSRSAEINWANQPTGNRCTRVTGIVGNSIGRKIVPVQLGRWWNSWRITLKDPRQRASPPRQRRSLRVLLAQKQRKRVKAETLMIENMYMWWITYKLNHFLDRLFIFFFYQ